MKLIFISTHFIKTKTMIDNKTVSDTLRYIVASVALFALSLNVARILRFWTDKHETIDHSIESDKQCTFGIVFGVLVFEIINLTMSVRLLKKVISYI